MSKRWSDASDRSTARLRASDILDQHLPPAVLERWNLDLAHQRGKNGPRVSLGTSASVDGLEAADHVEKLFCDLGVAKVLVLHTELGQALSDVALRGVHRCQAAG